MAESQKDQFVWALFENYELADEAARQVLKWDKALGDIKLGPVGVFHLAHNGRTKTHYYGPRNTRKGAKVGMLFGVLAAFLPAVTLVGGLASGAILGGIGGRLSKQKLGLTTKDMARIKKEVEDGKAILIVACDDFEVEAMQADLANLGGIVENHSVSSQDLEESAQELIIPVTGEIAETHQE